MLHKKAVELLNYLTENDFSRIVLDSNEILKSPQNVLEQLCDALDIPFSDAMLHWPAARKKKTEFGRNTGTIMCIVQPVLKNKKRVNGVACVPRAAV
jgi:hypothetical protein